MLQEKTGNAYKTTNIEAKAILLYNIIYREKLAPAGEKK